MPFHQKNDKIKRNINIDSNMSEQLNYYKQLFFERTYKNPLLEENKRDFLDFINTNRQEVRKILNFTEWEKFKKNLGKIDWLEFLAENRKNAKMPKFIPIDLFNSFVMYKESIGEKPVYNDFMKILPDEELQIITQDNQNIEWPKTDKDINNQWIKLEQWIIEIVANAIDATIPFKNIGRFGEWFYQSLGYLKDSWKLKVVSKKWKEKPFELQFISKKWEIQIWSLYSDKENIGTEISLARYLSPQEEINLANYIRQKFKYQKDVNIILNGDLVNNLDDYIYKNWETLTKPTKNVIINIHSQWFEVIDNWIWMNSEDLAVKLVYPKSSDKIKTEHKDEDLERECKKEVSFFYKTKKVANKPKKWENKTKIALTVVWTSIEEFEFETNFDITDFCIELPSFTWLPDSRNRIELNKEVLVSLGLIMDKISEIEDTAEKIKLLDVFGKLIEKIKDRTTNVVEKKYNLDFLLKKHFEKVKESIEKDWKTCLPANDELIAILGKNKHIVFVWEQFLNLDINKIPWVEKIHNIKNEQIPFYAINFAEGAKHDYLITNNWILVNKKYLKSKESIKILNIAINLNTSYEIEKNKVFYGTIWSKDIWKKGIKTKKELKQVNYQELEVKKRNAKKEELINTPEEISQFKEKVRKINEECLDEMKENKLFIHKINQLLSSQFCSKYKLKSLSYNQIKFHLITFLDTWYYPLTQSNYINDPILFEQYFDFINKYNYSIIQILQNLEEKINQREDKYVILKNFFKIAKNIGWNKNLRDLFERFNDIEGDIFDFLEIDYDLNKITGEDLYNIYNTNYWYFVKALKNIFWINHNVYLEHIELINGITYWVFIGLNSQKYIFRFWNNNDKERFAYNIFEYNKFSEEWFFYPNNWLDGYFDIWKNEDILKWLINNIIKNTDKDGEQDLAKQMISDFNLKNILSINEDLPNDFIWNKKYRSIYWIEWWYIWIQNNQDTKDNYLFLYTKNHKLVIDSEEKLLQIEWWKEIIDLLRISNYDWDLGLNIWILYKTDFGIVGSLRWLLFNYEDWKIKALHPMIEKYENLIKMDNATIWGLVGNENANSFLICKNWNVKKINTDVKFGLFKENNWKICYLIENTKNTYTFCIYDTQTDSTFFIDKIWDAEIESYVFREFDIHNYRWWFTWITNIKWNKEHSYPFIYNDNCKKIIKQVNGQTITKVYALYDIDNGFICNINTLENPSQDQILVCYNDNIFLLNETGRIYKGLEPIFNNIPWWFYIDTIYFINWKEYSRLSNENIADLIDLPQDIKILSKLLVNWWEFLEQKESENFEIPENQTMKLTDLIGINSINKTGLEYMTDSPGIKKAVSQIQSKLKNRTLFERNIYSTIESQDKWGYVWIREVIQNSRDAIKKDSYKEKNININFFANENSNLVTTIEDSVGMTTFEVFNYLLNPWKSGKSKEEWLSWMFGQGFFTLAVQCEKIKVKTSTWDGNVTYIEITPILKDSKIVDFDITYNIKKEDFKWTYIERVDIAKDFDANMETIFAISNISKFAWNIEDVQININGKKENKWKEIFGIETLPWIDELKLCKSKDGFEKLTKDDLYISEINDRFLDFLPEEIYKKIRKDKLTLDLPHSIELVKSRNSITDFDENIELLKPYIFKLVINYVLNEFLEWKMKFSMLPLDYFRNENYEFRWYDEQIEILIAKYNENIPLTKIDINYLQNNVKLAQFLVRAYFIDKNWKISTLEQIKESKDISKAKWETLQVMQKNFELGEKRWQIEYLKNVELWELWEKIYDYFWDFSQKILGYKFELHIFKSQWRFAIWWQKKIWIEIEAWEKWQQTNIITEEIIDTIIHEIAHLLEQKLFPWKWWTHENEEKHEESFIALNRYILTELLRFKSK